MLTTFLVESGLVANAREARRVIDQGAVFLNGRRATGAESVEPGMLVRVGRRRVTVAVKEIAH